MSTPRTFFLFNFPDLLQVEPGNWEPVWGSWGGCCVFRVFREVAARGWRWIPSARGDSKVTQAVLSWLGCRRGGLALLGVQSAGNYFPLDLRVETRAFLEVLPRNDSSGDEYISNQKRN